jgi:hypothetical protein
MEVRFGKITIVEGPGIKPIEKRVEQEIKRSGVKRVLDHTDSTYNSAKTAMLTGKHLNAVLKRLNLSVPQDIDFEEAIAIFKPHILNKEFCERFAKTMNDYIQEQEAAGEKIHRIQVKA